MKKLFYLIVIIASLSIIGCSHPKDSAVAKKIVEKHLIDSIKTRHYNDSVRRFYQPKIDSINHLIQTLNIKIEADKKTVKTLMAKTDKLSAQSMRAEKKGYLDDAYELNNLALEQNFKASDKNMDILLMYNHQQMLYLDLGNLIAKRGSALK